MRSGMCPRKEMPGKPTVFRDASAAARRLGCLGCDDRRTRSDDPRVCLAVGVPGCAARMTATALEQLMRGGKR